MGAGWTCSGGTWAAAIAAKSSEDSRPSVTDASITPSSFMGAKDVRRRHLGRRYRREEQQE